MSNDSASPRYVDAGIIAAEAVDFALTLRGADVEHFQEQVLAGGAPPTRSEIESAKALVRERLLMFAATGEVAPDHLDAFEAEAITLVESLVS